MGITVTYMTLLLLIVLTDGLNGTQYSKYAKYERQLPLPFQMIKGMIANMSANQHQINSIYSTIKKMGKIQKHIPHSQPFFCDAKNGPGRRSKTPPESVNRVRPGDIDIIGAIGDSLTAANGAISTQLIHIVNENRGISWSIGGRDEWRKYLTLPNILREFNSNLYGYATEDSQTVSRASKFNIAEPLAFYADVTYESKILLKRMQRDPKVDMDIHWKLITAFFGCNDICSRICDLPEPLSLIEEHKKHIYEALRFLRDNFPRTIINWVVVPELTFLTKFVETNPMQCFIAQRVECNCIFSSRSTPKKIKLLKYITRELQKAQIEIVNKSEFHTDTFTVIVQPFTQNLKIPTLSNGNVDLRYFASDCFHFSQMGHATAANALWNNMMQRIELKSDNWTPLFEHFECPSQINPFIATRENGNLSIINKVIE